MLEVARAEGRGVAATERGPQEDFERQSRIGAQRMVGAVLFDLVLGPCVETALGHRDRFGLVDGIGPGQIQNLDRIVEEGLEFPAQIVGRARGRPVGPCRSGAWRRP
jgi:hypothetical protein